MSEQILLLYVCNLNIRYIACYTSHVNIGNNTIRMNITSATSATSAHVSSMRMTVREIIAFLNILALSEVDNLITIIQFKVPVRQVVTAPVVRPLPLVPEQPVFLNTVRAPEIICHDICSRQYLGDHPPVLQTSRGYLLWRLFLLAVDYLCR